MSAQQHKQAVKAFFGHAGRGEVDAMFAMMSDDATWWLPGDAPGGLVMTRREMHDFLLDFFPMMKKHARMEIHEMTAEDDRICALMTARDGVTRGGIAYANDYHLLVRFADGMIAEIREYQNPIFSNALSVEFEETRKAN